MVCVYNVSVSGTANILSAEKSPSLEHMKRYLWLGKLISAIDFSGHLISWQKILASDEGIYAEPTSATALAGAEKLIKSGDIDKTSRMLIPITGSGLKDEQPN